MSEPKKKKKKRRPVLMTERTMKRLKERGVRVEKVEQWIPFVGKDGAARHGGPPGVRKDLFGFIDLIALDEGRMIGIQACAMSGQAEHVQKIKDLDAENANVRAWLKCGGELELWAWRKLKVKRGGTAVRWEPNVTSFRWFLEELCWDSNPSPRLPLLIDPEKCWLCHFAKDNCQCTAEVADAY